MTASRAQRSGLALIQAALDHNQEQMVSTMKSIASEYTADEFLPYMETCAALLTVKFVPGRPSREDLNSFALQVSPSVQSWFEIESETLAGTLMYLYNLGTGLPNIPWDVYSVFLSLIISVIVEQYPHVQDNLDALNAECISLIAAHPGEISRRSV
jgi:hypothetical protein